jgi:hypothetical protein
MDTIQDQIRELQTSVRRQRLAIVALASVLTGIALIGAVRPAESASFDKITCDKILCNSWTIVDKDGVGRITAGALLDGNADMRWLDKDGRVRIHARTDSDLLSGILWYDKDGKRRITAGTLPDGRAGVEWRDKNEEKLRISASTNSEGDAYVIWRDKDGKKRITAGTNPDDEVIYPTKDGE